MEHFYQVEDRDGLRFSWNIWPTTHAEYVKLIVPIACIYTPLKSNTTPTVYYEPVMCKGSCKAYLNPYCQVDFTAKTWTCPFCTQRNAFPPHYQGLMPNNLPAELMPNMTSMQYILPPTASPSTFHPASSGSLAPSCPASSSPKMPPAFIIVLDIRNDQDEFQSMKDTILNLLDTLPPTCFVGLITFGTMVQVYDLSISHCNQSYIFKGTSDFTSTQIQEALDLGVPGPQGMIRQSYKSNYILPLQQCESNLQQIIEQLVVDPTPVKNDKRPLRSTGVATSIAISLMELTFSGSGGRIMIFMGGPCTQGPGLIVSDSLSEPIRSHHDLKKEIAKHLSSTSKFFSSLSARAASNGHAIDLYSLSYDQTGLLEMKSLVKNTGGILILADSFQSDVFRKTLVKLFEALNPDDRTSSTLSMGLNATIKVITTPEIKIQGAIGHLASMSQKTSHVSDRVLGIGHTNLWKICAIDPNCSYAFYFEVSRTQASAHVPNRNAMIQFLTTYFDSQGNQILKVTTSAHGWSPPDSSLNHLLQGFDQEAATALIARLAVFKSETENINAILWLDRQLIALLHQFSDYRKGDAMSLQIPQSMSVYHQFMFYLRRGPLIQVFNNSPDETVYFSFYLLRENVSNILVMIQPTLDSYTLDIEPQPVMLSATSVTPNNVLLLDTYFYVVVHYGTTIAQWREAGYQKNPAYGNLMELIEIPKADASDLISGRIPMPIYVECDQGTSQARFLMASVDPAITHKSDTYRLMNEQNGVGGGQIILSEDVSLQAFGEALKKKVVQFSE